jgi:twinkle protein
MAEFVQHIHCEACGSSDANSLYDDGSTYCFSCEKAGRLDGEVTVTTTIKDESWTRAKTTPISVAVRGISPNTYKKYGYAKSEDGSKHVITHYDVAGNVVAQKFRHKDKTFNWAGKSSEAVPFGMGLWRSGGKRIYITEGELDCLSVAEAVSCKYPVISINNGAQAAKKDLAKHMEYLNSFEEIALWFDNDTPGRKATQEVASLFPPGKVVTCGHPQYKDANDLLVKEGKSGVMQAYYELTKLTPDGIVNANEGGFDDFVSDATSDAVYDTPFKGLTLSKGSITTFVSGSGMGKSTITKELGYDLLIEKGLNVGHVALEESNAVSKRAYVGIHMDEKLTEKKRWVAFKEDKNNLPKLKEAYDTVIGSNRLYLYNHFGSLGSDNLINKLRFLALGAECDFLILDHISIVVSGLDDMGDNERRTIDVLMTKLRSLVEETGVGMILVSHLKRPPGEKGHEDGVQTRLAHLRGSASIAQLSDEVIGLEGDQQDEDNKNIRTIRRLKDREGGETGIIGHAEYFPDFGRLMATDRDPSTGFKNEGEDKGDF